MRNGREAICSECQKYIELGRGVVRDAEPNFSKVVLSGYKSAFEHPELVTPHPTGIFDHEKLGDLRYVTSHNGKNKGSLDDLLKAIGEFMCRSNAGVKTKYDYILDIPGLGVKAELAWSTPAVLAFAEMWKTLVAYAIRLETEAYNRGRQDGEALLLGLATGEKSVEEFNAATVRTGNLRS